MSAARTVIETAQNLPAALGPDLTAAVDLAKAEKAASGSRLTFESRRGFPGT